MKYEPDEKVRAISKIHRRAMDLAVEALKLKKTDPEKARPLFMEAFELERESAEAFRDSEEQPTRSVLYRSAATLAMDVEDFAEARRLAEEGLSGKPPGEIRVELEEVLAQVEEAVSKVKS